MAGRAGGLGGGLGCVDVAGRGGSVEVLGLGSDAGYKEGERQESGMHLGGFSLTAEQRL